MTAARQILSSGPYGDAGAIADDVSAFMRLVDDLLHDATGIRLPDADENSPLSVRSIRRGLIMDAYRALTVRKDIAEARLIMAEGLRITDGTAPRNEVAVPGFRYALAGDWSADTAGRAVQERIGKDLAPHTCGYVAAGEDEARKMADGIRLLTDSVGELGASVLSTVSGAVLVTDCPIDSGFLVPVPFASVVNIRLLEDPVALADAVFHESCHQKFYDVLLCRRVVNEGYGFLDGTLFDVPWRPIGGKKRQMDCLRILSTLHVYSHLLEFLLSLEGDVAGGSMSLRTRLEEYWRRASFFHELSRSSTVRDGLGPDAGDMADWLDSVMARHQASLTDRGMYAGSFYREEALRQVAAVSAAH
ncbi:hypothetical protein ACFYU9_24660 [Streptomyces sp. NPDC004327]|uniref:hypothetical protein n=2 Tax=unclassified Streptomyces TaxID=2593676 RepID=UPI0036C5CEA7